MTWRSVTVVAALAGALALAGCSGNDPGARPSSASPGSPVDAVAPEVAVDPPVGVRVVELQDAAVGVASVSGRAWFALPDAGAVLTSDDERVAVGSAPLRLAETPFGVWVSVIQDGTVVRIDPRTSAVDQRVRIGQRGSEPEGVAYADGALWVVDQAAGEVSVLDPDTGAAGSTLRTGTAPRLVTVDGSGGAWVANYEDASVTHVIPTPRCEGRALTCHSFLVDTVDLGRSCLTPQGLAQVGHTLWVACTVQSRLVAVDARTGAVVAKIGDVDHADAVVTDGADVFVVGQRGPTVWRLDAGSGTLGNPLVLDDALPTTENVGAAVVGGDLVVTHPDARRAYTVPLRLLRD